MGNLLFALVVGLSTPCTEPGEAAPPASQSAAVEKLLEERMPEDDYAFNGVLIPRNNALSAFRTSPLLDRGDATILSTPLPGRGVVPEGAYLAAPVITPSMNHGHLGYDVIPAGPVDSCDPIWTRHPEDFVFGPAADPLASRVWGSAEVLLGTTRGVNVPPLVTTGPTAEGLGAATLGAPGTVAIFGGKRMLDDWRAGLRSELGVWFDDAHVWGASARFYSLFSTSEQLVGGNGRTVIYIPHEGDEILERTKYVYFPGAYLSGTISTTAQTNFAGGDISVRRLLGQGLGWQIYGLAGYRQLHLG
ncbi:MAG TPA: BBP7 family outer membrane beta-barrel protein, partial [Gemmata sp.]|nr:BBP7 family outer membrane beta-barrel protein [Gemmata sp.]